MFAKGCLAFFLHVKSMNSPQHSPCTPYKMLNGFTKYNSTRRVHPLMEINYWYLGQLLVNKNWSFQVIEAICRINSELTDDTISCLNTSFLMTFLITQSFADPTYRVNDCKQFRDRSINYLIMRLFWLNKGDNSV